MTISKTSVATGIYFIEIPQADLRILCGCPADAVKHLINRGLISTIEREFMPFVVAPDGRTLGEHLEKKLLDFKSSGSVPRMLTAKGA